MIDYICIIINRVNDKNISLFKPFLLKLNCEKLSDFVTGKSNKYFEFIAVEISPVLLYFCLFQPSLCIPTLVAHSPVIIICNLFKLFCMKTITIKKIMSFLEERGQTLNSSSTCAVLPSFICLLLCLLIFYVLCEEVWFFDK